MKESILNLIDPKTATLVVKVSPKASSNRLKIDDRQDGPKQLRVYVTTAPEDGKANKAVIELVAGALGIAKSAVTLLHGETSRKKVLKIIL